jgi:hypothetical protein
VMYKDKFNVLEPRGKFPTMHLWVCAFRNVGHEHTFSPPNSVTLRCVITWNTIVFTHLIKLKFGSWKCSLFQATKLVCEGIAPSILKLDNIRSRVISFKHGSIIHVENVRIHTEDGVMWPRAGCALRELNGAASL